MSSSQYRPAKDGYLARVSGDWAREKLYYLKRYMSIFNGGMKNRWPSRVYIDLLAGPGRCIDEDSGEEFDGSPLLALQSQPAFSLVVLVEHEPAIVAALEARTRASGSATCHVIRGDANSQSVIDEVRRRVPRGSLALMFVDLLGLEVTLETIRLLTSNIPVDLLVTFQVNDLARNVPLVLSGEQDSARLDEFFGTTEWRQAVKDYEAGLLQAPDVASALTDYYADRLATVGYASVTQLHRLMRNTRNAPLYRLVLAGKHERAAEFFQKISRIEYSGQRSFLT